jgi:hypothetical protein
MLHTTLVLKCQLRYYKSRRRYQLLAWLERFPFNSGILTKGRLVLLQISFFGYSYNHFLPSV